MAVRPAVGISRSQVKASLTIVVLNNDNMPRAICIPRKVIWLTTRTLLPMRQMHTPPAPPTDAPPAAQERVGQQRQQRWRRRQHCQAAAPAAARQGAQSLAGAAGEAHASFPERAADVLTGGAADVRP
jgi:hypothetical protein